ncbi:TPA: helix-turn-helix domain-containing protein [Salmonella enterica]|uniref:STY4528 family pathogenicity island replication protein n=1 Tax=Salmonella enterica TaxID=28901 RepID=UPI0009AFC358|nr:STY4528 family pathogenicity island replication protein [Salmonella enterica]HBD1844127.1 helix-turn-helix domain-containing protein [Salmonella enterica]
MQLPANSLIAHAINKMNARLEERIPGDTGQVRSGLLYMGNVHDAFPRRLLLDDRLSPLDKIAWMMIRLYAQQNEGAVFPTYDELQLQLASPHKGKASRETVSRVLLMLRITGWLSLCKRVRDENGRVRGNIYAQHDEPLSFRDAESFDPSWLDTVADACRNKNDVISKTARQVLAEIKDDPLMRHRKSYLGLIEDRLGAAQTPLQMAERQRVLLSSEGEPGEKILSSGAELRQKQLHKILSSGTEPSGKSRAGGKVREPNRNVRSITRSVKENTYVVAPIKFPDSIISLLGNDAQMLTTQLQALPTDSARLVLDNLQRMLESRRLNNPVGWLLAMMKRAREGQLFVPEATAAFGSGAKQARRERVASSDETRVNAAASNTEHVRDIVAEIRQQFGIAKVY